MTTLAGGAALVHGAERASEPCTAQQGLAAAGCGFADVGSGVASAAGWTVIILGGSALVGGVALIVAGASPAPQRPRTIPAVSVGPRAVAMRWAF